MGGGNHYFRMDGVLFVRERLLDSLFCESLKYILESHPWIDDAISYHNDDGTHF